MEIVERLTLEAARERTMLACEHRQRYDFAAPLCGGARVLDLCCGSGYGTAILAEFAETVVGVDNDAATVELAGATVAQEHGNAIFELADAIRFLEGDLTGQFDVVVCFEGLEHLHDVDRALMLLQRFAEAGGRLVVSVPNSRMFQEQNPFHLTDFGYQEAREAFAAFPNAMMLPQYLAEGALICPPEAAEVEATVSLEGRDEPAYANHFIFAIGFAPEQVARVHRGRIQLNTSPLFNRWSVGVNQALAALRRENARLGRERLGKSDSAAASALAKLSDREAQIQALEERCRYAEARVEELELELNRVPERDQAVSQPPVLAPLQGWVAASAPGEDPNSWDSRRRRAAEVLIPWIEQTVALPGAVVLEYGCGNAAVSCAFAERAERVIGLDIDPHWIELGHKELEARGIRNVELELHPLEAVQQAARARRGEVDVFLLYAVLEHLTVAERLEVLRLAREVVKPDGAIIICETPNRLIYFDHHTAQIPFFHLLPDQLAADYSQRSPREDFRAAIQSAAADGRDAALEAIARWGRGVSFHEFELVFGGELDRHIMASNYDPLLFPERPVHADEVLLARYLERWRPDLAPVWSRYWLDLILSPQPVAKRSSFLRPWTAETIESPGVGWTSGETLYLRAGVPLWIGLPQPTAQVVVGVVGNEPAVTMILRGESSDVARTAEIEIQAGQQVFVTFDFEHPEQRVGLSADRPVEVVLVAFEE